MTNQLEQAQAIYRTARAAGSNKAAAERLVHERLPGFRSALAASMSDLAFWGRAIQEIEKDLAAHAQASTNGRANGNANANGNGRHPTLFPDMDAPNNTLPPQFATAPALTRWLFDGYVERARAAGRPIQPGCTYTFSPNQCAAIIHALTGRNLSRGGFVNEFLPKQSSLLQDAGWRFETVARSTHELYTVKITAIPAPPPTPEPDPPPAPTPPAASPDAVANTQLYAEFAAFLAWRNTQHA